MCGRFTQTYSWQELRDAFALIDPSPPSNMQPRYNIAPTQDVDVILPGEGGRTVKRMRWWLVPMWWKKPLKDVPSTFNARCEGIASKPMFRSAFKRSRCIIPASGFYEWTGGKGNRLPWYISASDNSILSFAGLYERWTNPETDEQVLSCTIVTCPANAVMAKLHKRMPVVLGKDDIDTWMAEPAEALLKPAPDDVLQAWRVDPRVNSSRYQGEDAIKPIGA